MPYEKETALDPALDELGPTLLASLQCGARHERSGIDVVDLGRERLAGNLDAAAVDEATSLARGLGDAHGNQQLGQVDEALVVELDHGSRRELGRVLGHLALLELRVKGVLGLLALALAVVQVDDVAGKLALHLVRVSRASLEIGLDLVDSGYDYFAGGAVAQPNNEKSPAYKGDIYELAAKAGYKVVKTREDFRALSRENDANNKVIACGIEGPGYMPNYIDNHEGLLLTDFVKKGIELLDNPKGFFMMCEGGAIDVNCHANDAATVIFETLAFNDAVKVAYEFAQKHPQETLIVITGDHETGALTLGFANTGFRENIDKLALQKSSFGVIKDKLKALGKNKQDLVFDDVKPILTDSFSFKFDGPANDPMTITAAELEQLKAAFDLQYKSEKKNGNAVQVTALKIFNAKVGIAWHSGGHSALPVITSAWGNGSERFNMGEYENTFISHTMKELVK